MTTRREYASGRRVAPAGMPAALLGQKRLDIRAAAVADLEGGRVDPLVEKILLQLGREHHLSVSVFATGYPGEVFGTPGISNHTRGRAVDVWAMGGRPVAGMATDDPGLLHLLRRARELGNDEIGGPVNPDGTDDAYFANTLHRDHVHIGFDA